MCDNTNYPDWCGAVDGTGGIWQQVQSLYSLPTNDQTVKEAHEVAALLGANNAADSEGDNDIAWVNSEYSLEGTYDSSLQKAYDLGADWYLSNPSSPLPPRPPR
jgi:hypothetical protein